MKCNDEGCRNYPYRKDKLDSGDLMMLLEGKVVGTERHFPSFGCRPYLKGLSVICHISSYRESSASVKVPTRSSSHFLLVLF